MNAKPDSHDTDESLTKVDVDRIVDHEWEDVIPSCDFVVVGYDSSYSDADVSTKRVEDPDVGRKHRKPRNGKIIGTDADDPDRKIGFGSTVWTSRSSGRIGNVRWVAYPAPEPDKTTYDVTFRALAGRWSRRDDVDDLSDERVDELVEATVDKYSYDDVRAPPKSERFVEDVQVDNGTDSTLGGDFERRATVDVPVTLTVADVDTTDVDEVVERARKKLGTGTTRSMCDRAVFRDDLPELGDHILERSSVQGGDKNMRKNVRYWVVDVDVEVVD